MENTDHLNSGSPGPPCLSDIVYKIGKNYRHVFPMHRPLIVVGSEQQWQHDWLSGTPQVGYEDDSDDGSAYSEGGSDEVITEGCEAEASVSARFKWWLGAVVSHFRDRWSRVADAAYFISMEEFQATINDQEFPLPDRCGER